MMDLLIITVLLVFCIVCDGFYNPFRLPSFRSNQIRSSIDEKFDFSKNIIDITPEKDGGILKKVITRGNGIKGSPQTGDLVLIDWVFYDEDLNIIHDSIDLEETFHFTLGVEYQVIKAFDIAVRTMYEGETCMLRVSPEYGFGVHGESKFKPNQTLIIEFSLEELVVGLRQYENINEDYDITKEIQGKIDSGEINPKDYVPEAEVIEEEAKTWTEAIPEEAKIPAAPMPFARDQKSINQVTSSIPPQQRPDLSQSSPPPSEGSEKSKRRFFDPTKDKLHPDRSIQGFGEGHVWDENIEQIVLEVSIPEDLEKNDLHVDISSTSVYVASLKGDFEFGGELQGKINPSESSWLLDGDDPTSEIRGKRLIFNFQKSSSTKDLWGSFFNRKILEERVQQKN